jgi:hypothetical protein
VGGRARSPAHRGLARNHGLDQRGASLTAQSPTSQADMHVRGCRFRHNVGHHFGRFTALDLQRGRHILGRIKIKRPHQKKNIIGKLLVCIIKITPWTAGASVPSIRSAGRSPPECISFVEMANASIPIRSLLLARSIVQSPICQFRSGGLMIGKHISGVWR